MSDAQRTLCESFVRDHWDESISTEQLLERAAQYVNNALPGLEFDCSDVAEVIHEMP